MKTEVFESYESFLEREDKTTNGVSQTFSEQHPNYEDLNSNNIGYWNCVYCKGRKDFNNLTNCKKYITNLKLTKTIDGIVLKIVLKKDLKAFDVLSRKNIAFINSLIRQIYFDLHLGTFDANWGITLHFGNTSKGIIQPKTAHEVLNKKQVKIIDGIYAIFKNSEKKSFSKFEVREILSHYFSDSTLSYLDQLN